MRNNISVMDGVRATIGFEIAKCIIFLIRKGIQLILYVGFLFLFADIGAQRHGKNNLTGEVYKPVRSEAVIAKKEIKR